MPSFAYRAATPEGELVAGIRDAIDAAEVERALSGRGLYPLDVSVSAEPREDEAGRRRARFASRRADVAEAFATLAALLGAGLPLDRALEVAADGAARADVGDGLVAARRRVREGGRLSDALEERPRLFPRAAVGLVRAGERGGHLTEAVRRLAEHLERERALRSRLLSALLYPLLLLVIGAGALAFLLLWVLPRFVELLGDAGAAMPRSTALLLDAASLFGRAWPLVALCAVACVAALVLWRRTDDGRARMDAALLRLPVIGPLRIRRAGARLGRTVGTLLSGGLPLVVALEIAADAADDVAVGAAARAAGADVRRGAAFSAALRRTDLFPHVFVRLVEVGEETGELDALLERAATLLEAELERRLERMVAMVEPALILAFGLVIGFVAVALLQGIYGVHAGTF